MVNLAKNARQRAKVRCRKFSVLLMQELATGHVASSYRVPCKSWACKRCAKKKADQYSRKAMAGLEGERVRFLTLTIKPQESLPGALKLVSGGWNRLNGKIKRKYGKYKYFKVLEVQRGTGMPHLHVLINKYLDKEWLNKAVVECGFGLVCDIRAVPNGSVVYYVTKYLKKGIHNDEFESALLFINGRRLSFSRGFYYSSDDKCDYKVFRFGKCSRFARDYGVTNFYYPFSDFHLYYPVADTADWWQIVKLNPDILLLPPPDSFSQGAKMRPTSSLFRA